MDMFVGKDPSNNCNFFSCPEPEHRVPEESSSSSSIANAIVNKQSLAGSFASAMHGKNNFIQEADDKNTDCDLDLLECSTGIFVGRNPLNNCKFIKCPASAGHETEEEPQISLAASISSSLNEQNANIAEVPEKSCNNDIFRCTDGSFVSRDPNNVCEYFECDSNEKPMAASIIASSGRNICPSDLKECPDGSFVGRDPDNGCKWITCIAPTPHPTEDIAVSMAGSVHSKYQVECTNELFKCTNGSYVGQDPDDKCKYYSCDAPNKKPPTQRPTNHRLSLNTSSGCTKNDLMKCSDGSFVSRDIDNECKFFSCTSSQEDGGILKAMSQLAMETNGGQGHHKKNNNY